MLSLTRLVSAFFILTLLSGCAVADRMADTAERAADRALNRQVDRRTDRAVTGAIDGAFDVGENAVRCAFNDDACIERAARRGEDVVLVDRDGNYVDRDGRPVRAGDQGAVIRGDGPSSGPRPGGNVNTGVDFTPGSRVLFQDDFESTRLGNVPGSVRFVKGTMEVVEERGNKVLRLEGDSVFGVQMGERPSLFTLEFDTFMERDAHLCITTDRIEDSNRFDDLHCRYLPDARWTSATMLQISSGAGPFETPTGFFAPSGSASGTGDYGGYAPLTDRYVKVRATMDGTYLKVYLDDTRVVNIPNAQLAPGSELIFFADGYNTRGANTVYIDNLRVGAGGQETGYATLATGGRVTARGILFDSGKATLSGSSETELRQLKAALDANPNLRVRIEGHTDASGGADTNRALSQRRADAVMSWLVRNGISSTRLMAVGYGEDQPVASNDTASGREQNRRVEIVGL